jgi:serine/threonine protein kinase
MKAKVMDFGIARLKGGRTQQTKIGHLIGTVLYMSPEQVLSLEPDCRVDIFALGVILYQLLTGKHPFAAPDQIVTLYNITHKPAPPVCSINPNVPEALGRIVERCLNKDRENRYHTMAELRSELLQVLPILVHRQATCSVTEAREAIRNQDWNTARNLIRRVFELDPANDSARDLVSEITACETAALLLKVKTYLAKILGEGDQSGAIDLLAWLRKKHPEGIVSWKQLSAETEPLLCQELDRLVDEAITGARTYELRDDLDLAIETIDSALLKFPDSGRLVSERNRLNSKKRARGSSGKG